jgi:hypothetical protein
MAAMAAETATPVKAPPLAEPPPGASEEASATAAAPKGGGKGEKGKKDAKKDSKKKKPEAGAGDGPSLAGHPRAVRSVARAKSWGGLAGFLFAGYVSLPTSTIAEAGMRALVAGVICYVATWAGAVFVWRRFVILEIKAREQQLIAAARARAGGEPPAPAAPGRRAKAAGT